MKTDEVPHLRPPGTASVMGLPTPPLHMFCPVCPHTRQATGPCTSCSYCLEYCFSRDPTVSSLTSCLYSSQVRPFLATPSRITSSMHSHHLPRPSLGSNCLLSGKLGACLSSSPSSFSPWHGAINKDRPLLLTAFRHSKVRSCRIGAQYRSPRVNAASFKRSKGKHTNGIHQHSCSKNCPSKELQTESTGKGGSLPWHRCCDSPAHMQTPISCPRQPSC